MSSFIMVEVNSGRDTVLGGSCFTMLATDPEHPFPRWKEGGGGVMRRMLHGDLHF